jgi:hypothetical protein
MNGGCGFEVHYLQLINIGRELVGGNGMVRLITSDGARARWKLISLGTVNES